MDCFRSPASQQDLRWDYIRSCRASKIILKSKQYAARYDVPCVPGAIVWQDNPPELGTTVATTKNFEPNLTPRRLIVSIKAPNLACPYVVTHSHSHEILFWRESTQSQSSQHVQHFFTTTTTTTTTRTAIPRKANRNGFGRKGKRYLILHYKINKC